MNLIVSVIKASTHYCFGIVTHQHYYYIFPTLLHLTNTQKNIKNKKRSFFVCEGRSFVQFKKRKLEGGKYGTQGLNM